jgi:lipopolysaccharide/colanic/teichoic acid biosynthesis glycosyltransferase
VERSLIEPTEGSPTLCENPVIAVRDSLWSRWFKRPTESLLALVFLVLAAPLILFAAVLIKLTSPGPAFYSQTRLGRNRSPFTLYKIRTMAHDCERLTGPQWAKPNDPRVIPVGGLLRRLHLDELPQLWNVVCGHMSLIGPRPERPEIVADLLPAIPHYSSRLLVRPGLSGLAQLRLPPDTDLASVRRKLRFDLYYLQRRSFGLDLRIAACTPLFLLGLPSAILFRLFRLPDEAAVLAEQPKAETQATVPAESQIVSS